MEKLEQESRQTSSRPLRSRTTLLLLLAFIGGTVCVVVLVGTLFSFQYIQRSIQSTSLTFPLLADDPLLNQIAFVGNDNNMWLVTPDGETVRSLTSDSRGYQFPTWAPDGRRLAFIGRDERDVQALFVSPTRQSEPVVVFNEPRSAPFYLYWSPDSHSITFLTQERRGLAMNQIDTRAPDEHRVLGQGAPFYWVWSPDSDKLLLHVGGSRAASQNAHISFLNNMAEPERVELDLAPGRFQAPVWSPDGQFVYYIATEEGREAIYRLDVVTLETIEISELNGATNLVLSSDGRHLAYLQLEDGTPPPFGRAYLVPANGDEPKLLTEDPIASMYWSPDGTKLALLSLTRGQEDGSTASRVMGLAAPLRQETQLRWWIYDVADGSLEPLMTFRPTPDFLQTIPFFDQYHLSMTFWSPDSRYFVVTKGNSDQSGGTIWVVDTTGQEQPLKVGEGRLAVWSWK